MRFLSVCSGIEAASLALNPLGFEAAAFAEVDPFCCSLLKQRCPGVPNLGDLTKWRDWDLPEADMLVGGTPCQAFSVAGKRRSLLDERSNLAMNYVDLFHAGRFVCALWENVPGVLNTDDNAFGHFLGGIVGSDNPLREPPDGRWPSAGMARGPRARLAWRVLDAQYFGVPQRRRRVFVVASSRDWFDPAQVLFEPKAMQRASAARREARKDIAGTLSARTKGGGGLGTDFECDGGLTVFKGQSPVRQIYTIQEAAIRNHENIDAGPGGKGWSDGGVAFTLEARDMAQSVCYGANNTSGPIDVAATLSAHGGPSGRQDFASETFVFNCKDSGEGNDTVAPTLRAMGHDGSHANAGGQLAVSDRSGVRRLLPVECERLQGIPDGHTAIIHRGKPATDGPRYKSIGNSWAVPVVAWIGERIKRQFDAAAAIESLAA